MSEEQAKYAVRSAKKKPAMPTESIMCLALIRPGSELARKCQLEKPGYCIYEYDRAFDSREIRWGDGSWQKLTDEDHRDLVLLEQFDEQWMETNEWFNG